MIAVVECAYLLRAPWLTRLLPLIAEAFSTNSDFKAQTPTCAPSTGHGTPALLPRGTGVRDQHQHCLPALHCQDGVPAKRSNTCDRARSNLRSEPNALQERRANINLTGISRLHFLHHVSQSPRKQLRSKLAGQNCWPCPTENRKTRTNHMVRMFPHLNPAHQHV